MFSGLKQALQKRDLELSASTFMSDFELNIRNSFTEHFDKVSCKGCMFHFSKCIWSRVKKSGLQQRYSVKSQDPIFGTFVRALIGLPFVKISDLNRAVVNIEKIARKLSDNRCKKFAKEIIKYIKSVWINGEFPPELWNMFLHEGHRTNNICEGFNYKLGAKKSLSKHPNVYVLISALKDELIVAADNAICELFGKSTKRPKKAYQKNRERQEKMMHRYEKGLIDLYKYQLYMGAYYVTANVKKFVRDLDPDPYGLGDPQTYYSRKETTDVADESSLSDDEEMEVITPMKLVNPVPTVTPIKIVNPVPTVTPIKIVSQSVKKPAKQRLKHKRQKPVPNSRISILNVNSPLPLPQQNEDSLKGDNLRQQRINPTTTAVIAAAALATATLVSIR